MRPALTVLALAASLALPSAALADEAAINARQAQMTLFAFNVATLGGMAQERIPYDAEAAQRAADHLYHLTRFFNPALWPQGSDNASAPDTAALPPIWDDLEQFAERFAALQDGVAAMQPVAGNGLSALQGAMGGIGGACQACHQAYRAP